MEYSGLKRLKYPMPEFVDKALKERGLMKAYQERPTYQHPKDI